MDGQRIGVNRDSAVTNYFLDTERRLLAVVDGRHTEKNGSDAVSSMVQDVCRTLEWQGLFVRRTTPPKPCANLLGFMFTRTARSFAEHHPAYQVAATVVWIDRVCGEWIGFLGHKGDTAAFLVHRDTGEMRRLTPAQGNEPLPLVGNDIGAVTVLPIHIPVAHTLVVVNHDVLRYMKEDELCAHARTADSPSVLVNTVVTFAKRRAPNNHGDFVAVACSVTS